MTLTDDPSGRGMGPPRIRFFSGGFPRCSVGLGCGEFVVFLKVFPSSFSVVWVVHANHKDS